MVSSLIRLALEALVAGPRSAQGVAAEIAGYGSQQIPAGAADLSAQAAETGYSVQNGTAVIRVRGALTKYRNIYEQPTGLRSYESIGLAVDAAIVDPKVKRVVLDIDSGGGTIAGAKELSDLLIRARCRKPLATWINGQMSGGAYWIGSAGQRIGAPRTGILGGLGLAFAHFDYSGRAEKLGVKITHLCAGKFKTAGNNMEPLSTESKSYLESRLATLHHIMTEDVRRNLGVGSGAIREIEDGREFVADDALGLGLITQISSDIQSFIVSLETLKEPALAVSVSASLPPAAGCKPAVADIAKLIADLANGAPAAPVNAMGDNGPGRGPVAVSPRPLSSSPNKGQGGTMTQADMVKVMVAAANSGVASSVSGNRYGMTAEQATLSKKLADLANGAPAAPVNAMGDNGSGRGPVAVGPRPLSSSPNKGQSGTMTQADMVKVMVAAANSVSENKYGLTAEQKSIVRMITDFANAAPALP